MDDNPPTASATDQEIVEALATQVMGWEIDKYLFEQTNGNSLWKMKDGHAIGHEYKWNPLTDWNHTWEIIEAMKQRKCCILLEWQKVVDWNVAILPNHVMAGLLAKNDGKVPEEAYMHEGDDGLQKTICLAALSTIPLTQNNDAPES